MQTLHESRSPVHSNFADALAYLNDSIDHDLADYRPGWQDGYAPTPEADAEWAALAARLEDARAEQERLEYEAWLDELALEREPSDAWHDAEVVRAVGCVEARKAVGA